MSEIHQESKRVEEWLTQGRPRALRTRGAVRVRSATVPTPSVTIKRINDIEELLEQLKADVPAVPWVVVVDGRVDAFAEQACTRVKNARESSKFWVVDAEGDTSAQGTLAALSPLHLDLQNADDARFLENLVADLVIITAEPHASQGGRLRRWLPQTRYIVVEEGVASLLDELRTSELVTGSGVEICLIKGED